jgi:hypothetical protein
MTAIMNIISKIEELIEDGKLSQPIRKPDPDFSLDDALGDGEGVF